MIYSQINFQNISKDLVNTVGVWAATHRKLRHVPCAEDVKQVITYLHGCYTNYSTPKSLICRKKKFTGLPFSVLISSTQGLFFIQLPIDINRGTYSKVKLLAAISFRFPFSIGLYAKHTTTITPSQTNSMIRRINLIAQLKECPHVVPTYEIALMRGLQNDPKLFMVQELANIDLIEYIRAIRTVPMKRALEICLQILKGLEYLHSKKIIHGDIKPDNILINVYRQIYITDFNGSIDTKTDSSKYMIGTFVYLAPEFLSRYLVKYKLISDIDSNPLDHKVDMWGLGCIMYIIFQGTSLPWASTLAQLNREIKEYNQFNYGLGFPDVESTYQIKKKIFQYKYLYKKTLKELGNQPLEHLQITRMLLDEDPKKRPEALQVSNMLQQLIDSY